MTHVASGMVRGPVGLSRVVLLLLVSSLPAMAWGPAAEGGVNITLPQSIPSSSGNVSFTNLIGPIVRAGFEVGDRFNHAVVFEYTQSNGSGTLQTSTKSVGVRTLAGRYTFSVDFLKKKGFTPSLGVGMSIGQVTVTVSSEARDLLYLAFHASAGLRYTFASGLGLRLDLAVSTYGGFVGFQPTAGVSYQF